MPYSAVIYLCICMYTHMYIYILVYSWYQFSSIDTYHIQESMKADYVKTVKDKIKQFSTFLGEKKWFAGENVCLSVHWLAVYTDNNL